LSWGQPVVDVSPTFPSSITQQLSLQMVEEGTQKVSAYRKV